MDNMEYIKSLEERIEKLEKILATIKLNNNENITFSNCQFFLEKITKLFLSIPI